MSHRYNPFLHLFPAALLGVAPVVAAQVADASRQGHAEQPMAMLKREPLPGVFSAGQPEQGDWPAIADAGVRTVIDLRPDSERPGRQEHDEVRAAGLQYLQIPVAGPQDLTPQAAETLWNALQVAAQRGDQVLVHCASANRAGALLALATALHGGKSASDALQLGRDAGMASTESRVRDVLRAAGKPAP